jgi:hypothetical protein
MAGRTKTRNYEKRLAEAGGIGPVYRRLALGETIGQIAGSLLVSRAFLSAAVNADKARLAEARGGKDRGGTGKLTPLQLEARIQRQMASVSRLDQMIAQRLAWIENLQRIRADKIATIEQWKTQFGKNEPMRSKEWWKARSAKLAKFSEPTPAELAPNPAPMWSEPAPAGEPEAAAAPVEHTSAESVSEPASQEEYSIVLRRWDRPDEAVRRVAVKPLSKRDDGPRMSATLLVEHGKRQRVPKARQIQVIRLDRD